MTATRLARLAGLVLLAATGCGASARPDLAAPQLGAGLAAEWRVDLVDNGFFLYAPTELGRVALDPAGRTAYVGTSEGRLVAVDTASGEVRWELELGEPIDGQPVIDGGMIYFGAADGAMRAADAAGGSIVWTYEAGGNLDGRPFVTDDRVIFTTPGGFVVCLSRGNGELLWTYEDTDPIVTAARTQHPPIKGQGSPLVHDGRVYAGFSSGRLVALDLQTGGALWTSDLAGDERRHTDVDEPPVWADGHLFASSFANGLHALDADGNVVWRRELEGATRPAIAGNRLTTTTVDGTFHVLDLATGDTIFSLELEDRAPGRVELVAGYALVPTSRGALYVLDVNAPHVHARFDPDSGFASATVAAPSRVVAYDNQGVMHGLTLRQR